MDDGPPRTLLDFTRAVAGDVRRTLAGELEPQPLEDLVDEGYVLAERLAQSMDAGAAPDARRLPVCKAGCDSCCRMHAVFVSPMEALRLASYLRRTRTEPELATLRERIEELAPRVADMSLHERAVARLACPLLEEATGACGVHPARPLLCRGYNSCDASVCQAALAAGDETVRPPSNASQMAAHKFAFAGFILGGAAGGREAGPFELVCALRAALAIPDAEARWLSGEPVFAGAVTRIGRERAGEWRAFIEREAPVVAASADAPRTDP
jgi:Fe-S-cluster containining protein